MKRKVLYLLLCMLLTLSLTACEGKKKNSGDGSSEKKKETIKLDTLTGQWKSTEKNDTWMSAVITDDTIQINWISNNGENQTIYWIGTYIEPEAPVEEYEWTSFRDKEQTKTAFLASADESKVFTYADGTLSFEVSTSESTSTVKLVKE